MTPPPLTRHHQPLDHRVVTSDGWTLSRVNSRVTLCCRKVTILKRMLSPERATVWQLQQETGVNRSTLYAWQSKWKQEGVLSEVRASKQQREVGMSAQEKFHTVIETAHYNEAELSTYCRERGLYPEQVKQWQLQQ